MKKISKATIIVGIILVLAVIGFYGVTLYEVVTDDNPSFPAESRGNFAQQPLIEQTDSSNAVISWKMDTRYADRVEVRYSINQEFEQGAMVDLLKTEDGINTYELRVSTTDDAADIRLERGDTIGIQIAGYNNVSEIIVSNPIEISFE